MKTFFLRITPIVNRTFAAALTLLCLTSVASAQDRALSERDFLALVAKNAPTLLLADARMKIAEANVEAAGILENPSLAWDRETTESSPASREDMYRVGWRIDLAKPFAREAVAEAQKATTGMSVSLQRAALMRRALSEYYLLVAERKRVDVIERTLRALQDAESIVRSREQAGEASEYELARIQTARALLQARAVAQRGVVKAQRHRIARWIGDEDVVLPRDFVAIRPKQDAENTQVRLAKRVRAQAKDAEDAAAWAWLPAVGIAGGYRASQEMRAGRGYILGLSIDIPLFDRGQGLAARAEAQQLLSEAQAEGVARGAASEILAGFAQYDANQDAFRMIANESDSSAALALRAAKAAYREGEARLVEVLDATQALRKVEEQKIDLMLAMKRAELRIRAARGEFR